MSQVRNLSAHNLLGDLVASSSPKKNNKGITLYSLLCVILAATFNV